jgi:hypothetical protein
MFERLYTSCFKKSSGPTSERFECELHVTNRDTKYQLVHGRNFKYLIEPRDMVLEHDYDFMFYLSSDNWDQQN